MIMAAPQNIFAALVELRDQLKSDQRQEMARAIAFHHSDPRRSAYHTGLADGRNGMVKAITDILNSSSIPKGYNINGRQRAV